MTTRYLAAILAADVVGFSSMMEKNEEGTLAQTRVLHTEIVCPCRWISRKPDHIFHPDHPPCCTAATYEKPWPRRGLPMQQRLR